MAAAAPLSRTLWLLPIAIAICALMVLPGASMLVSGAGPSSVLAPANTGANGALGATALLPSTAPSAALLTGLPASVSQVPWIQSITHQGPSLKPLTSLPNLALLKESVPVTGGHVNPFYVAQPAPLGLADYGLGAKTYAYQTSDFMGQVTFNSAPNVTDPASTGVIEPGGAADGYVGSVHEFGIQLNTVASQIRIPGTDKGFFWTQNVVDWNDSGIHFVDDTFNVTSGTQDPFFIAPGTIYSGCNNNSAGVGVILYNYGGVFQCVGGTIPVTPASYPVTIQLYNNASVNAQNRDQVAYGFRIVEAGTGTVYTGISDTVVFGNPTAALHPPRLTPGFSVNGFAGAPAGLFRDAEIVLVGDIGGDNAVFRSVSGAVQLERWNSTLGVFQNVPSAYNFGGDTGETSTGIADYWTPSGALEINQGPAMLYGLWNAITGSSVMSGDVQLSGTISPSYGFVFVSNTPAPLDPWAAGARDNMSWLPTTNSGTFTTYLPPLGAPWTRHYYVEAFADGYAELSGLTVSGSTSSLALALTPSPGNLNAPLYMFSNAQAGNLEKAVTGFSGAPYVFTDLVVNVNASFDHLNDYGYASFVVFTAQGLTKPVVVNNVYEGQDSPTGNYYFYDFSSTGSSGVGVPGPFVTSSLPDYTSGIALYEDASPVVTNQVLAADGYGLQLVLWHDSHARIGEITSELGASGVWVGDSVGATVVNVGVYSGATGVSDIGSTHTVARDISVVGSPQYGLPTGVEGLSSSGGSYSWISVANGGVGVSTGADFGAGADYDSYYYLPGTSGITVSYLSATDGSLGANITLSEGTTMRWVSATIGSTGVVTEASSDLVISHVYVWKDSTGVSLLDSSGITVNSGVARDYSVGVIINNSSPVVVKHFTASNHSIAVEVV